MVGGSKWSANAYDCTPFLVQKLADLIIKTYLKGTLDAAYIMGRENQNISQFSLTHLPDFIVLQFRHFAIAHSKSYTCKKPLHIMLLAQVPN